MRTITRSSGSRARPTAQRRLGAALAGVCLLAISMVGSVTGSHPRNSASAAAIGAGPRAGIATGSAILWASDADLARDLDQMAATGAKWIRFDFPWSVIEATPGTFDWSITDRMVQAASARGLSIIAMPAYTPGWARPPGTTDKHGPTDPQPFASFVGSAVQRYAPLGVKVWEVWNEPNLVHFWAPRPDAGAYTRLLQAATTAVRGTDPTATVLSAGLSPAADLGDGSQIAPITFLNRMYDAGARGSFDAVGMHPYSFPARPMEPASWNPFYNLPQLHDVMVANGDGAKQIWSTEFGAPTGTSSQAVSEGEQSAIAEEAYAAMAQWPWAGPLLWYAHRDMGTDPSDREQNFGLTRNNFVAKPALSTFTTIMQDPPPPATTTTSSPTTTTAQPPQQPYSSVVLGDQPSAYWRLGEASGTTAADASGNGRAGTYAGPVAYGQPGSLVSDPNTAVRFDGGSSLVTAPDAPSIRLNGAFTIEMRAKQAAFVNTWPGLLIKGNATTANGYLLWHDSAGRVSLKRNNQEFVTSAGAIGSDRFRHLMVTYDGTAVRWYVDGILNSSAAASFPANLGTSPLQLGRGDQAGANLIDEVALYPLALTPSQAESHHRAATATTTTSTTTPPPTSTSTTTAPPTATTTTTPPAPTTTTTPAAAAPGAPVRLMASRPANGSGVQLTWQPPVTGPATGYRLYRGTSPHALSYLAAVPEGGYRDTTTTSGVLYYYQLSAINTAGEGPRSNMTGTLAV